MTDSTYNVSKLLEHLGISAKKSGTEWQAKCPIHKDSAPSWHIEDEVGIWWCFGCSTGGGPVSLVYRLLDFRRPCSKHASEKTSGYCAKCALDWLRARNLIEESITAIPDTVEIVVNGRTSAKPIFRMPAEVHQTFFEKWPKPIRQYVLARKIDIYQVDRWKLGYAVDGRLGGRIVFPIEDENGVLASYTARSFDGREPRYTTPQPSENPNPGVMFGARYWPPLEERKHCTVVLTEGAVNALACERAGAMFVAALGGSPLAPLDIGRDKPARASDGALAAVLKLSGWGRVLVATDPDKAGEKVATAIRALGRWTDLRRVEFPAGVDAADMPLENLRELLRGVSKNSLTSDYSVAIS